LDSVSVAVAFAVSVSGGATYVCAPLDVFRLPRSPVCVYLLLAKKKYRVRVRVWVCILRIREFLKQRVLVLVTCRETQKKASQAATAGFVLLLSESWSESVCVRGSWRALHINNKCSSPVAVHVLVCLHSVSAVSCVQYQGQDISCHLGVRVNNRLPNRTQWPKLNFDTAMKNQSPWEILPLSCELFIGKHQILTAVLFLENCSHV